MKYVYIATLAALLFAGPVQGAEEGKHLFILSGQSNMKRLDPNKSFTPIVEKELGKDNIIVVKSAFGGKPILRWYKKWAGVMQKSNKVVKIGDLYEPLMTKVNAAIKNKKIKTVTFVWMQGEADGVNKGNYSKFYKESLLGLLKQLRDDLKRDDMNYVIGRLSQWGMDKPSWVAIRKAQVEVAEASPHGAWVDTDDVDINGVHYKGDVLGKRFAEKAIALIKKNLAQ